MSDLVLREPTGIGCRKNNSRGLNMRLDGSEWIPAVFLLWISLLIGWLIPAIVVLVMKRDTPVLTKSCPYCAESIHGEAKFCKHCGKELPVTDTLKNVKPSRWD
jgi:hypothetical protein